MARGGPGGGRGGPGPIAAASGGLRRLASLVVSAGPAAPGIKIYFLSLSLSLALSLTLTLLRIVFVYTRPIAEATGAKATHCDASRGARRLHCPSHPSQRLGAASEQTQETKGRRRLQGAAPERGGVGHHPPQRAPSGPTRGHYHCQFLRRGIAAYHRRP